MRTHCELVAEALDTGARGQHPARQRPERMVRILHSQSLTLETRHGTNQSLEGVNMSVQTEAEAGAKTTAEGLIATAKTSILAASKVTSEAEVKVETEARELAVLAAEAAAKVEVEAKTITTLKAELATLERAADKSNEELREKNAKILSLTS